MKEASVWVRYKKKYKATTNSDHKKPIDDNELKQDFVAQQPDLVWCMISPTRGHQKAGCI
jgi:transposase InsO family protein